LTGTPPCGHLATAVVFDHPVVAAIDVRGGGPGTREGALLARICDIQV
jgi:hypothetical protein